MNPSTDRRKRSSVDIPLEEFRRLYETTNGLLTKSVFASARYDHTRFQNVDPKYKEFDALDRVAYLIRKLYNAESCGIFLTSWQNPDTPEIVDWNKPHSISLAGTSNEKGECHMRDPRFFSRPVSSSFTLQLANLCKKAKGPIIIGGGNPKLKERNHFRHLKKRLCHSLMAMPLFNHKGRFIGFVRIENKKDKTGKKADFQSPTDQNLIISLSEQIVLLVELRHFHDSLKAIMSAKPDDVLKEILRQAVYLLYGNRADFTYCSDTLEDAGTGGKLKYAKFFGEYVAIKEGDDVQPGFILDTWEDYEGAKPDRKIWQRKKNSRWTGDVHAYKEFCRGHYRDVHAQTRSEIAVRFTARERPLGVLNVEAFTRHRFDERDEEILQIMAQHAAVSIQVMFAQEKQMAKTQLYVQLVNGFPNMMIIQKDKEGKIIFANKAFQDHTGKTEELILAEKCDDFTFFEAGLARQYQANDRFVMYDEQCPFVEVEDKQRKYKVYYQTWREEEHKLEGANQKIKYMDVTKIRMLDGKGQPQGVQCIFSDVTDQVHAKGRRLIDINHRVRNSIFQLRSFYDKPEKLKGMIESIYLFHKDMYLEVEGKGDIKMKPYMTELIERFQEIYNPKRAIHIDCEIDEGLQLPWQIAEIIPPIVIELITNSLKHAFTHKPANPTIHILLTRTESKLFLKVKDNGQGFPSDAASGGTSPVEGKGLELMRDTVRTFYGLVGCSTSNRGTEWQITIRLATERNILP